MGHPTSGNTLYQRLRTGAVRAYWSVDDEPASVRWIALDVETTGLHVERGHRVRQVALLDDFGGGLVSEVLPDTPKARRVARSMGVPMSAPVFGDVAADVLSWLGRGVVVGHNVTFDLRFLESELRRYGRSIENLWFVDTMDVAARAGVGGTLAEVADSLDVSHSTTSLHDAPYDARLAGAVLDALVAEHGFHTLRDLRPRAFAAV